MDKYEALDWFLRRRTMAIADKCQEAENIAIDAIMNSMHEWIPVKDQMPPEHDTIFTKLKGTNKWNQNMFAKASDDVRVVVRFEDGTRMVSHDHTFDGKWRCEAEKTAYPKRTVTHWMENPGLPEDET